MDQQPRGRPGTRERGVTPARCQIAWSSDDDRGLDGRSLHAVAGQRVGVLGVLGDVLRWQLSDEVAVGFDHDAMLVEMADSATRPVIHIKQGVVAPADHAVAHRQLPGTVGELLAKLPLVAKQRACRRC